MREISCNLVMNFFFFLYDVLNSNITYYRAPYYIHNVLFWSNTGPICDLCMKI